MLRSQILELSAEGANRRQAIMEAKSEDYSMDTDALLNFKQVGKVCKVMGIDPANGPEDAAMFFVIHKMQRYLNLRDRDPMNESVQDTIDDWHNYIDLAHAARIEKGMVVYCECVEEAAGM